MASPLDLWCFTSDGSLEYCSVTAALVRLPSVAACGRGVMSVHSGAPQQ